MMEDENYTVVLESLKSPRNKRDPRSLRLAAVAAAMLEVVGGDNNISAAKVFAATISALERTLKSDSPQEILDSISTQVALLELLRLTVPHVANPVVLEASLPLSSRVLRGIVASCLGMDAQEMQQLQLETKDELGGVNAVLRAVCRAVTELIKRFTPKCDAKLLKQFYSGTLLGLFDDRRPKVRKASQNGIVEILLSAENNSASRNTTFAKLTTTYCHNQLRNSLKRVNKEEDPQPELLHLLGFLERAICNLDVMTLGADIMELLVALLKQKSSNAQADFVTMSKRDSTAKMLAINALLSTVKELLESSSELEDKAMDAFCPRALATLLQNKPSLVFLEGSADLEIIHHGRTLYGSVVIASCKRVIVADPDVACKLLPVSIQIVLQLCRIGEEEVDEDVAEPLMAELSAILRSHFPQLFSSACARAEIDTCVTKSLKTLEQVMLPSFQSTWSVSLKTLVILLQLVGKHEMLPEIVGALLKLRNESKNDVNAQRAVDAAIGSLIEGVGIEEFWNWVDWTAQDSGKGKSSQRGINLANSWLLPVMKTASAAATGRPHLEFFQKNVLDIARRCATLGGNAPDRVTTDKWVIGLWSLFPCFCRNPVDIADNLEKLIPTLVKAMEDKRYPQLLGVACFGLETLAVNVKERVEMDEGILSEETKQEQDILSKVATVLLPVLFKNVERLYASASTVENNPAEEMDVEQESRSAQQSLADANLTQRTTQAIATLAEHAPKAFLEKLFKKLMKRLLEESQSDDDEKNKLCSLLNLSQALVASKALDESSVTLLYRTMKPMIRNDEHGSKVQKLSYKVLAEICRCHHAYVSEAATLSELIDLLTGTAMTSQVSARNMRLKCMLILIEGFEHGGLSDSDAIAKMTGEVLLCLKDSKAKTRDTAYQVLIALANASGNLTNFLCVVTAALAAETTHMRSAAVMAASRLVFEFAREDHNLQVALPSLLQTVLILFDEQSREVIKSAVGFVRVCVAAMPPDQLEPFLRDVVGSLLKYHKGKDRFRAKIKIILKKLVRLYGYDKLMPFVPESESRLLVHMRKLDERAARRKAANRAEGAPETHDYDAMVGSDEDDSDNGRTLMTGATGLTRKTGQTQMSVKSGALSQTSKTRASSIRTKKLETSTPRLPSENDGEVVNILSLKEKNVRFADVPDDSDSDDDGMMEFDDLGRLVVNDDPDEAEPVKNDDAEDDENMASRGNKRRRLDKAKESDGSVRSGSGTETRKKQVRDKNVRQLGAAYKSRKAGGDVKKKGQKYEPYAYVPLDGRSYSKKNRRRAVEQMATVVPQGGKRKRN